MPRLTVSDPRYRLHKASGQAVVTIGGVDHYLGRHGTPASRAEYHRLIAEWVARGRPTRVAKATPGLTVSELVRDYRRFCRTHYVKNGKPTSESALIRMALKPLLKLYRHTAAADFGPLKLKAVRQEMIDAGLSRPVVNRHVGRIRRLFKWGVANELVKVEVLQSLQALAGLQKGRTIAREPEPIKPIADEVVETTLPHCPPTIADMIRLQRLTGARPAEICSLRPCDIDRSADVWLYRPQSHKTEHHGRERLVLIGPKAQAVLLSYLLRGGDAYCFSPAESEKCRRRKQREERQSKVQPSQRNRKKRRPVKSPGDHYTASSYRRAIHNACDRADAAACQEKEKAGGKVDGRLVPRWSPNRLRHSAATEIRSKFGLEVAQILLGHARCDVTEVYAERDLTKAVAVVREVG